MRLRISEKLKSFFPDADFVTEDRNIYDLAVNRKVLCMCTTGTDEYTHANIVVAIVESKIYLDRNDNEQTYISSAMTQRQKTTDDVYGMRYVETAETAAVGRALADVGFGIQFFDSEENDSTAVDSPFPKFDF